jgi:ribonuclease VapC
VRSVEQQPCCGRIGDTGFRELDLFVHRASLEAVAVGMDQVVIARRAFRRYGRATTPRR